MKLRNVKKIDLSIAIELEDENTIKVPNEQNRLIFSYLPTKANFNFPFMVNSYFTLDTSRSHLHENVFLNRLIIETILPKMLFLFINEIGTDKLRNQFILNILPNNYKLPDSMIENFRYNLDLEVFKREIFPNTQNKLKLAKNLILDKIEFFPLTFYDKSYFKK